MTKRKGKIVYQPPERCYTNALYKRVMADGKITLDEIEEIIEEVTDIADETKEMIENEG